MSRDALDFWDYVLPALNGCWVWIGGQSGDGYGIYKGRRRDGRQESHSAHRHAYGLVHGPVPDGLVVDHLCVRRGGSKLCVRPDHLEPVTNWVNTAGRGTMRNYVAYRAGTCTRGHRMTLANTYVRGDGRLRCRTCRRTSYSAPEARLASAERSRVWRARQVVACQGQ